MTPENIELLRKELVRDEGEVLRIYKDHLGYPTVGIGHLIKKTDPEFGKPIGTRITAQRSKELFAQDFALAQKDAARLVTRFDDLPAPIQRVLVNMVFNMGFSRLSKFRKMRAAVNARDWDKMVIEMKDSDWYLQVPNRAKRLIKLVQSV